MGIMKNIATKAAFNAAFGKKKGNDINMLGQKVGSGVQALKHGANIVSDVSGTVNGVANGVGKVASGLQDIHKGVMG